MTSKTEPSQQSKLKQATHGLETEDSEKLGKIIRLQNEVRAVVHASDCAVYNAPAMPPGACTCGGEKADR
jgi:hypothetical protein